MERVLQEQTNFFASLEDLLGSKLVPLSCARAGMVLGLSSLGLKRMDEILVAPFMCQAVIGALSRTAFPSMNISDKTKAIMVFHQFGFPQKMDEIIKEAKRKDWIVVNDAANTIFSTFQGKPLIDYGDFTVLSFSKVYPCLLGGAFWTADRNLFLKIQAQVASFQKSHEPYVLKAYDILRKYRDGLLGETQEAEIAAIYGFLPTVVTFPKVSLQFLPATKEGIEKDNDRRRTLLKIAAKYFSKQIPLCEGCDVIATGVPIAVPRNLELISAGIKKVFNEEVPVLHFDYNRNMLKPDYRKALVIGFDASMTEEKMQRMCEYIQKEMGV